MTKPEFLKEFTSWVQEKGFIWGPEPELYGGLAGFYTYGPMGKLLKNKIENSVRKVFTSNGFWELEGPTVLPNIVWKASGHLDTFKDPVILCSKCNASFRPDKLIQEHHDVPADSFTNEELLDFINENKITCPSCGGTFKQEIERLSLMMKTVVAGQEAALRPETATVTYLPYKRFHTFFRKKLPIGVFQIGKAYRNEISPRQSIVRGREFTQAEGQLFIDPQEKNKWELYEKIKSEKAPLWTKEDQIKEIMTKPMSFEEALKKGHIQTQAYAWAVWLAYNQFKAMGIPAEHIRLRQHQDDEKAFYAADAWDIEVKTNSYGWVEMCGIHDRTDYDLTQHGKFSKTELDAVRENGEHFIPHVLEIAFGTDRPTLGVLDIFYDKKEKDEGKTTFKVPYRLAPIDIAIFPLLKKEELLPRAEKIKKELEREFIINYDVSGTIGKRYLRAAELGTPYCITVDFEGVTIRDRDTEKQIRVPEEEITQIMRRLLNNEITFEEAGELI